MKKLIDADELKDNIKEIANETLHLHNCLWDEFCERIDSLLDNMPNLSKKPNLVNKYTVKSHINEAIEGLITVNTILNEEYYPPERDKNETKGG